MITFRCLMCSSTISASEGEQGTSVDCPECGASLTVPDQSVEAPAPIISRADSKVESSDEKESSADDAAAKSIFRAKRKAQQEAESEGKEFDSSKFDKDTSSRNTLYGVFAVLVISIGGYAYYLARPVQRLVLTDEMATALLQGVNTRDDSSVTSLLGNYMDAQCTCTETMGKILAYVNSQEKLEEVLGDLKRLSQIAITQNPLVNAVDRNRPDMQLMAVMEEYKGRQAGAHVKLEEEVKRIQKIDPEMAVKLRDDVAAIGLLDMFQN